MERLTLREFILSPRFDPLIRGRNNVPCPEMDVLFDTPEELPLAQKAPEALCPLQIEVRRGSD